MRGKAEAIVESARELIFEAEACTVEAYAARQEAAMLARMADEAQDMSVQLQRSAEEAVKVARRAIARLKGKEEEVSIQDLHQVRESMMMDETLNDNRVQVAAERLLRAVDALQQSPPVLQPAPVTAPEVDLQVRDRVYTMFDHV